MDSLAADLRQSETFRVLPQAYRDAWLDACLKLPSGHHLPPSDGEVFELEHGDKITEKVRDRLNNYGLVAGCEFTISKARQGVSVEVVCKHFGTTKDNFHNL